MIRHRDVEEPPRGDELGGNRPIVGRRRRVPARMVVDQDDRRRTLGDRLAKDHPRVHERRVENPTSNRDIPLETVLRIEHRDVELLDRQILESRRKRGPDITRRTERRPLVPRFRGETAAELERRVYDNRPNSPEPRHRRERGDRLRREPTERAVGACERVVRDRERRPSRCAGADQDGEQFARTQRLGAE